MLISLLQRRVPLPPGLISSRKAREIQAINRARQQALREALKRSPALPGRQREFDRPGNVLSVGSQMLAGFSTVVWRTQTPGKLNTVRPQVLWSVRRQAP
jgi:hypothetical protein